MKSAKLVLLVLLGGLFIGSMGCGGGSGGGGQRETDEVTERLLEKIFTPGPDGSPAVFDYAPRPESHDAIAVADSQNVHFVKYISAKDLNSDKEFVTTLHLNEGSEYIIKYSHGGRTLVDSTLGLRIAMPNRQEMILDFLSLGAPKVSEDVITYVDKDTSTLTKEEKEREIALDAEAEEEETASPLYVDTSLEVIAEENPCIILYRFTAPQTGDYEFAVSELTLSEGGEIVRKSSFDVPFEFRLYSLDAAHSVLDGEEIELSRTDILDIQRILLASATEFNENGLPVDFDLTEDFEDVDTIDNDEGTAENSVRLAFLVLPMNETPPAKKIQEKLKTPYSITGNKVIPPAVINNVPYDDLFDEGAGFYAHSGLRAVTDVVDDEAFSKNAVGKFNMPKPGTGGAAGLKEKLNIDVIATEKEHDRSAQLEGMSSFVLLRDAFGRSPRKDYARLGSDHTRIISVRYELAEEAPRMPDPREFKLVDGALDALKKRGAESFLKNYGDYFVAGYTWGLRYDATVEITAVPGKTYHRFKSGGVNGGLTDDPAGVCLMASDRVKTYLENAKINAISERDTGTSSKTALDEMDKVIKSFKEEFHDLSISVSHVTRTGTGGEASFTLQEFASSLGAFIKSAKSVDKAKYQKLYVTLRRLREIEEARPYIPEALTVGADLYTAIRSLTEKIFRTRCYYNALMVLPVGQLRGGKGLKDGWEQEFEVNLVNKVDKGLNYICADKARVQEYFDKFDALYKKYKALAERYNFYCYLRQHQVKRGTAPGWETSDEKKDECGQAGFFAYEYTRSGVVRDDMRAGGGDYHTHKEPWNSGPRGADFSNSFTNKRVYWFETGCIKTNYSKGWDVQGTTIGKKSYHWCYKGAASRRLEVYLNISFVSMPHDKYPFVGLE